jgi:hypothetical protein
MPVMVLRGGCLCGDVVFEIRGALAPLGHCHCSMCRKAHGAPFSSFGSVPAAEFRFLRGAEGVRSYVSSAQGVRDFCERCASKVPVAVADSVFVPLGLLDGAPQLSGALPHVFTASKAPWYEIADDAPRFAAFPPGAGEGVAAPRKTDPAPGVLRGGCLCGAVAYEVDAPLPGGAIVRCHCSRCRKARAAAHNANFFSPLERFRWLRGEDRIQAYKVPEAERFAQAFCGECGSPQPRVVNRAVVPAATLDDDPGLVSHLHIFVSSKAPWFEIRDGLPQFAEYPPPAPA